MPTVRTDDGIALAYETGGTGPLSLLFLHGWGGSGRYFQEPLTYLDLTGLRAITFDYRGHGDSDKPETGYTLERFARDAFAVADAAGADRVVVVGFSMSGKFAQYLACLEPQRVLGQVLIAGCPAGELSFPDELHRDWVDRVGDRAKFLELMPQFITQPVRPELLARSADEFAKASRGALDETIKMLRFTTFADTLRTVRIPTLVIGGVHDALFTPEALRQTVVAPLPGARLALVDSNHEVPHEQPQQLAALIEAFLAGLAPVPTAAAITP